VSILVNKGSSSPSAFCKSEDGGELLGFRELVRLGSVIVLDDGVFPCSVLQEALSVLAVFHLWTALEVWRGGGHGGLAVGL